MSLAVAMRSFRVLLILLGVIWLVPAIELVSQRTPNPVVFGRYAPDYFAFLVAYGLVFAALVALAAYARPALRDAILRPIRWVQRRPLLLVLFFYLAVEAWYFVRRFRYDPNAHPLLGPVGGLWNLVQQIRVYYQGSVGVVLLLVMLLLLYAGGILLFAGRTPAQRRSVAANLGLLVFSSGLAFVLFCYGYALVVKRAHYTVVHDLWTNFHQRDPVLGYTIRPNLAYEYYFDEIDQTVTFETDGQGFRNRVDTHGAPIAGVGDSFIFGLAVPNADLWSEQLGHVLGVPVANYGVMGYGLWQYNLVLDRYARDAGHELVIYGIFANDLRDDTDVERDIHLVQQRNMWRWQSPINYTIADVLDESPLYKLVQALRPPDEDESEPIPTELPNGLVPFCVPWAVGYDPTPIPGRLDRAIDLSDEIGYQPLFVTIPSKESVYAEEMIPACGPEAGVVIERERAGYEFLCDYVEERGYPCYDMTGDFRDAADAEDGLLYNAGPDGHWNPRGHEVFAQLLAAYLQDHHLLPEALLEETTSAGA